MEKKEFESILELLRTWQHPSLYIFSERLSPSFYLFALSLSVLANLRGKDAMFSEHLKFWCADPLKGPSHPIWSPLRQIDPEWHRHLLFSLAQSGLPIAALPHLRAELPEIPYSISNQPHQEDDDEETYYVGRAIEYIEGIRSAMQRDEQEIAAIQSNTQQLLDKLKAA